MSTVPAELILLQGAPNYQLVTGTDNLLWVSNTESDVFRMGKTGPGLLPGGRALVLVAGTSRPVDVRDAEPAGGVQADSRSSTRARACWRRCRVPTRRPKRSCWRQIPQTARVSRKDVKAPEVAYQGDPKFEPIESTTVARAVNTDKDIIKVGDLYYMCFEGVWFVSKAPTGPVERRGLDTEDDLRDSRRAHPPTT